MLPQVKTTTDDKPALLPPTDSDSLSYPARLTPEDYLRLTALTSGATDISRKTAAAQTLKDHLQALEAEPWRSNGYDLGHFIRLHRYAEHWRTLTKVPEHIDPEGFSKKYLSEPLENFSKAIFDAYSQAAVEDPYKLEKIIDNRTPLSDEHMPAMQKLREVYLVLRQRGYNHQDLTC